MTNFSIALAVLVLFVITPILRIKATNKDQRGKNTAICLLITDLSLLAGIVSAYFNGELSLGLLVGCSLIFGGIPMFIIFTLIFCRENESERLERIYAQTNQRPDEADYGFSKKNPIWAGTYEEYMKHIVSDSGEQFKWKQVKKYDLPPNNDINKSGLYGCIMFKINIIYNEDKIDTIYIVTKAGLQDMKTWNAPKGYKYIA